tara:strand:+ start:51 stop:413 length:363 start_codon:yes stop_codon:yes gene_type:complete
MPAVGCSLKEAFGEDWSAGPQYYQSQPQRFMVSDPYSTNVFGTPNNAEQTSEVETFDQASLQKETRITQLEAKVEKMSKAKTSDTFTLFLKDIHTNDRLDNVVRFALVSILISNFIDLIN